MIQQENRMKSISRNVILDLLPAYIAGEASEETIALVEEYSKSDPGIAELIRAGKVEPTSGAPAISSREDLERKTMQRIQNSIRRQMAYVAITTASILMVPLVAMQITEEVNWTPFDFIVMGVLLSGTGLAFVLISRMSERLSYKAAVLIAAVTGFLIIWINLAVGIIGPEDHPANLLYAGVFLVGIIGSVLSRLQPKGMARTLFAVAVVQMLVPAIASIIWKSTVEASPGVGPLFLLNGIFAALFVFSAFLFRRAEKKT